MLINNNDTKKQIHKLRSLNEYVDRNKVMEMIRGHDVVFIYYAGSETINKGYRTIEIYTIGLSKAGNVVIRAWQQAGSTDSGVAPKRANDEIPGWRMFRLDGITSMVKTLRKFDTTDAWLRTNRPHYNPKDRDMTQIFYALEPNAEQPDQNKTGGGSVNQPDVTTTSKPSNNFFRAQADKFKSFFQKPKDVSKAWIESQKRKFLDIMKKQNNN